MIHFSTDTMKVSRRNFIQHIQEEGKSKKLKDVYFTDYINFVANNYGVSESELNTDMKEMIIRSIQNFKSRYILRWNECKRNSTFFEQKYKLWIEGSLLSEDIESSILSIHRKNKPGRPPSDFSNLCPRSQRRRTETVRKELTSFELLHAAASSLGSQYKRSHAKIIQAVSNNSPNTVKRLKTALTPEKVKPSRSTPEDSLALMMDNKMTVEQYNTMRNHALKFGHDLYPPYCNVHDSKTKTYPDDISINEDYCSIPLQNVLNHTTNNKITVNIE